MKKGPRARLGPRIPEPTANVSEHPDHKALNHRIEPEDVGLIRIRLFRAQQDQVAGCREAGNRRINEPGPVPAGGDQQADQGVKQQGRGTQSEGFA